MSSRPLSFTKMHGLGNDYIYVYQKDSTFERPEDAAKVLSDRRFGVGGDGLVLITPSEHADFRMRMFNADGSESEMCGNAVRCIAKYVYERGHTKKTSIALETGAGIKTLELLLSNGIVDRVRVDMGEPILQGLEIPTTIAKSQIINEPFEIHGRELMLNAISMGNPHAVFFVPEITDELVLGLGPKIEHHPLFPRRTNVEFVRVINRQELEMRVWERGSGETLACGTGAAAVAVAAVLCGLADRRVSIHLRGGTLDLEWAENNHVFKTGPASFVFDGSTSLQW